jgi:hypothetical protein
MTPRKGRPRPYFRSSISAPLFPKVKVFGFSLASFFGSTFGFSPGIRSVFFPVATLMKTLENHLLFP